MASESDPQNTCSLTFGSAVAGRRKRACRLKEEPNLPSKEIFKAFSNCFENER